MGNFGDGKINAYDIATGAWLSPLYGTNADPVSVLGLWGISFGNGGSGGSTTTLYLTAGIPGTNTLESHGLFASLSPIAPNVTSILTTNANLVLNWVGGQGPFVIQSSTNLAETNWTSMATTTNRTVTITNFGSIPEQFYRILNQGD